MLFLVVEWDPEQRFTPDEALKHEWILEGLPPNVLYHHCMMYDVAPHEVPARLRKDERLRDVLPRGHQKVQSLNVTENVSNLVGVGEAEDEVQVQNVERMNRTRKWILGSLLVVVSPRTRKIADAHLDKQAKVTNQSAERTHTKGNARTNYERGFTGL